MDKIDKSNKIGLKLTKLDKIDKKGQKWTKQKVMDKNGQIDKIRQNWTNNGREKD